MAIKSYKPAGHGHDSPHAGVVRGQYVGATGEADARGVFPGAKIMTANGAQNVPFRHNPAAVKSAYGDKAVVQSANVAGKDSYEVVKDD